MIFIFDNQGSIVVSTPSNCPKLRAAVLKLSFVAFVGLGYAFVPASLSAQTFRDAPVQALNVCVDAEYEGRRDRNAQNVVILGGSSTKAGFPYNSVISTTRNQAINAEKLAIMNARRLPGEAVAWSKERLAMLENPAVFPAQGRQGSAHDPIVFFAPLYSDAYHACPGGQLSIVRSHKVLIAGNHSPRVEGDLCAAEPMILFNAGGYNFQNLSLVQMHQSSAVRNGLVPFRELTYSRHISSHPYSGALGRVLAVRTAQCGGLPESMRVVFERQTNQIYQDMVDRGDPHTRQNFAIEAEFMLEFTTEGVRHTLLEEGQAWHAAGTQAQRQQDRQQRTSAEEAAAYERLAAGVVLVFGSMLFLQSQADPCDPTLLHQDPYC